MKPVVRVIEGGDRDLGLCEAEDDGVMLRLSDDDVGEDPDDEYVSGVMDLGVFAVWSGISVLLADSI